MRCLLFSSLMKIMSITLHRTKGRGPINCNSGIFFDSALKLLQETGAATLDQFPYDPNSCSKSPTQADLNQARNYRIASSFRTQDLETITLKTQIADNDPVLAGVYVYPSFDQASSQGIISGTSGTARGYHAIVLIGYDDSKNAFSVQNSWGRNWGDNGRAWIDYATLRSIIREAYRVVPALPPGAFNLSQQRFGFINDTATSASDAITKLRQMLTKTGDGLDIRRHHRSASFEARSQCDPRHRSASRLLKDSDCSGEMTFTAARLAGRKARPVVPISEDLHRHLDLCAGARRLQRPGSSA
jgi:hypothetical protein